jgi:serine phosphatase RsbU (regulator of sigma subunit)
VIGDVSGKGLEAAALTSLVKNTIKAYAHEGNTAADILAKTNSVVLASSPAAAFVTVFLGLLNKRTGYLDYSCAGHPPALLLSGAGKVVPLEVGSAVVGVFEQQLYPQRWTHVSSGEILLLYTDGVIEARRNGRLFGEPRLHELVASLGGVSARELPGRIFSAVTSYTDGVLTDDIALLAVGLGKEVSPPRAGRKSPTRYG